MSNQSNTPQSPIWLELGNGFGDSVKPASFPKKMIRFQNKKAATSIQLDHLTNDQWIEHFADFVPFQGNLPEPQAIRYHGHQFTHYNPDLGDGRGFLFAQFKEQDSGKNLDLGTKGSGQTPYSRRGDGRLTLKGAVREALATAYLEYQGVNTSKTFSIIETGEELQRHDEPSPTRSAVLTRLSHSHIRFGAFQRLAFFKEKDNMQKLIDYSLKHYYPKTQPHDFFKGICQQVAHTTAQWMTHGFVHGVLNTDNMNITGESFDYGPYRFLPYYDPQFTAAYFDHQSLYAYAKQPNMVLWNLERLKDALQLCIDDSQFYEKGFEQFKVEFENSIFDLFCKKIGVIRPEDNDQTKNLFYLCLQFLEQSKAPFEEFYHHLYYWHQELREPLKSFNPSLYSHRMIEEIEQKLAQFKRDPNAKEKQKDQFQTLLIHEIEDIWSAIDQSDDWTLFNNKIQSLSSL